MRIYVEYAVVKSVLFLAKLLPIRVIYRLFGVLAALFFRLDRRRRSLTLKNLALAFPEIEASSRLALAKKAYASVGTTLAEVLLMYHRRFDIDAAVENLDEALEEIHTRFSDNRKGILLLTAHFGNWELLAHFLAKHGYPMVVIGRSGNNRLIEKYITAPFRSLYGNALANKSQAINAILRTLKTKGIAGMLIDQKASGANSIKASFFGHPADTVSSTALLKRRYDPPVIPLFMARQASGRYRLIIGRDAELALSEAWDETEKIARLTQHYNDIIEAVVKEYPEQWFWMHNRWRIRP